ncbi:MAG TPA: PPC domain-containing DNA-binding protein [Chryseolinea sp.]|nr:PPC domain-containing DNA-binding protein [Chryseolinea sp.]
MARTNQKNPASKIKGYAFRLQPHEDLKQSILQFAKTNALKAGAILSAVGSLEQYHIRFANQPEGTTGKGFFEIISLTGTFSESSCHLHICVADEKGQPFGGHLLDSNLIFTTAEIIAVSLDDLEFQRITDSTYNYKELVVSRIKK